MRVWRERFWRPWLCAPLHFCGGLPDSGKNSHVAAAAADQVLKSVSHLFVAGVRILVEQGLGRQHPAVQAVPALEGLFLDKRLLYRMRGAVHGEPFERDDLFSGRRRHRQGAGTHRAIIDQHGAGSALSQAAAESRIIQGQIVAQHVKQRAIRLDVYGAGLTIHFQQATAHEDLCRGWLTRRASASYSTPLEGFRNERSREPARRVTLPRKVTSDEPKHD